MSERDRERIAMWHASVGMEDATDNLALRQHVVISGTMRRSRAVTPKDSGRSAGVLEFFSVPFAGLVCGSGSILVIRFRRN